MKEEERYILAVSQATEKTKQIITLSTGILTITVSFSKDILGGVVAWTVIPLAGAWLLFLMSIVLGVKVLGLLAGRIMAEPVNAETLKGEDIDRAAKRQVRCFLCAVLLTVVFGICMASVAIHDAHGLMNRISAPGGDKKNMVTPEAPCTGPAATTPQR